MAVRARQVCWSSAGEGEYGGTEGDRGLARRQGGRITHAGVASKAGCWYLGRCGEEEREGLRNTPAGRGTRRGEKSKNRA